MTLGEQMPAKEDAVNVSLHVRKKWKAAGRRLREWRFKLNMAL